MLPNSSQFHKQIFRRGTFVVEFELAESRYAEVPASYNLTGRPPTDLRSLLSLPLGRRSSAFQRNIATLNTFGKIFIWQGALSGFCVMLRIVRWARPTNAEVRQFDGKPRKFVTLTDIRQTSSPRQSLGESSSLHVLDKPVPSYHHPHPAAGASQSRACPLACAAFSDDPRSCSESDEWRQKQAEQVENNSTHYTLICLFLARIPPLKDQMFILGADPPEVVRESMPMSWGFLSAVLSGKHVSSAAVSSLRAAELIPANALYLS
ncbi:hypothetical protein C8R45DRAFT_947924 [Mycena sanguinolenta]|nr:hypothetical protein C8R45DRAFT_947924 [Mycena sanguinolenta]